MTSELIQWHDLDGYARGVVDGHDKYLIQPVAFEGFHGYELIRPTSDGDLQLGYYKRVSTAKQIAEDKERARSDGPGRSRPERFERATAHEAGDTPDELMLYDQIRPHDRVTIVDRFGQQRTGRVVMRGPAGWVLNMGGQHGTPAIATPENVVRVRSAREVDETAAPWPTRRRTPGAREDAGPQGALDWKQRRDDWYAKTFGGAEYILSPEGEDGFHAYYVDGGKREDLGGHTTLGGAMAAARAHQPAMSRAAEERPWHGIGRKGPKSLDIGDLEGSLEFEERGFEQWSVHDKCPKRSRRGREEYKHLYTFSIVKDGGAWVRDPRAEQIGPVDEQVLSAEARLLAARNDEDVVKHDDDEVRGASERVPVLHEDDPEVAVASVTKTETVTVAVANEDFSTVAQAEQHAYTEGFRFIAKHGKRYHVYKRRAVGKKGYERREMYHRRGKWHISGDRKVVSRLGEGARGIKVSQTAGTIRREEQAPVAAPEAAPVEAMAQEAGRRVVHVPAPEKALTKDQQEKADRAYKEGLSAGDVLGNQMTTDEEGQSDIRRLHRKHELRDWTKRTAENEAEREDRGQYWQIGFLEGLRRTIDAWAKHNLQRYGSMASESPSGKLTLAQAKAELRPLGLILTHHDGEYRVNFRRGNEESAYYTPDLDDAVATGKDMAKRRAGERRISRRKPRKMAREDSKRRNLDSFTSGYAVAALWSSTDNSDEQGGDPLDDNYDVDDIASDTLEQMRRDCAKFQRDNEKDLDKAYKADVFVDGRRYNAHSAGFDFWLTRAGHGAGFWDRGLGAVGDRLTEASKKYGTFALYVQDGKVHGEPLKWKGVNESRESRPAASEASEPAKEEPAGVGCAPCDAASSTTEATEEKKSRRRSSKTGETVTVEQKVDKTPCSDGTCVPWLRVERDSADYEKRMEKAKAIGPIETPQQVFDLLAGELGKEDQEVFVVICLDLHGHLRGVFEVARGQRSKVSVGIQDVMRPILLTGCEGAIICHAHPSNNSSNPSRADRQLTKDIQDAIKPFEGECTLIDHVVLTTDTWYSILGNESSTKPTKRRA